MKPSKRVLEILKEHGFTEMERMGITPQGTAILQYLDEQSQLQKEKELL